MGRDARRRTRRLGLALAATAGAVAALEGSAAAAIPLTLDPVGGEVAPTISGGNEFNGIPDVAMNAAGDFVVAWRHGTENGGEIFVRAYRADGTPRSGEVRVSSATDHLFPLEDPSVAIDATGDFVVAWNRDSVTSTGQSVGFVRRYTAGATPAVPATRLAEAADGNAVVGRDAVGMDGAGNYTVAFRKGGTGHGDCQGVVVRRFRPSGSGTQADARVGADAAWAGCLHDPMLATASTGATVLIVQESVVGDFAYWRVWRRTVAPSGTPALSNAQTVESFRSYGGDPPAVDIADDGSIVVAFTDEKVSESAFDARFQGHDGVWVKHYDPSRVLTDTERANQGSDRAPLQPSVAISDSGSRWLATWADDPGRDGDGTSVRARSFARGQRGPVTQVNVNAVGDQRVPAATMGPGGDAVLAWQSTVPFTVDAGGLVYRFTATAALLRRFSTQGTSPSRPPQAELGRPLTAGAVEAESDAVPLSIDCPQQRAASCGLDLAATAPTATLRASASATVGRRSFRVPAGRVTRVRLGLSAAARAALRARGRLALRITAVARAGSRAKTYRGTMTVLGRQATAQATAAGVVTARVLGGAWVAEGDAVVTAFDGRAVAAAARLRTGPGVVRSVRLQLRAVQRAKLRAGKPVRLRLVAAAPSPLFAAARLDDPFPRVLATRTLTVLPPN